VFYPWGGVGFLLLTTRLPIEVRLWPTCQLVLAFLLLEDTLWPNHPVRFFLRFRSKKTPPPIRPEVTLEVCLGFLLP
jgi:hypothetical protein